MKKKHYLLRLNINRKHIISILILVAACLSVFGLRAQSDATVFVTAPAGAETGIEAIQAEFGPRITTDVSGPVAEGIDTSGAALGCGMITTGLNGSIALIDRSLPGTAACDFVEKAINAQNQGAIGVIICNTEFRPGVDQRYKAVTMGGDDAGVLTIPAVMIPYQQCADMRVHIGSGLAATLSSSVLPADSGETCVEAIEVDAGTHTVAPLVGGYGGRLIPLLIPEVSNTAWYSYTPASHVQVTVRSCGLTDADTRITIWSGPDCSPANLTLLEFNDDCDDLNFDFASELTFLATAGTRYFIVWDDRWDYSGFDFEIVEEAPPAVNVTFTVDMANETPGSDGVNMVWAFSDAATIDDAEVVALTDNGDNTWSGTVELAAFDTIGYAFMNGMLDLANIEAVPDDCGQASGFGFNIRPLIVASDSDITLNKVCYGTCLGTCPVDCGEAPAIFETLDNYAAGEYIGMQSATWGTWSGAGAGTSEDALVSSEQAFSPPNSVRIEGEGGPTDLTLRLGDRSTGKWELSWKWYVEPGRFGYYNIQDNQDINPSQWNLEVQFNGDGTGDVFDAGLSIAQFNYVQGEWIDVVHRIDLDNDNAELIIGGQSVFTFEYGPGWKLGAVNFFPTGEGPHVYYIDDAVLRRLTPCPEGAIICDGFEVYSEGPLSSQAAAWAPWTSSPADDGRVQADPTFVRTGCRSLEISDADPDDQLLLLGDRTTGNYLLEWYMYVPQGRLGYYNFQKFQNSPGQQFGMEVEWFPDGTATLDAGTADVAVFNWTPDSWMHFEHYIDLDNNWITMIVDGAVVHEWPANWRASQTSGVKQLGAVDFFGNTDVTFYLDDVLFRQLPSLPGNLCRGAQNIQGQLGQGLDNTVSSGPYDNTGYTATGQDPGFGYECFGEPDGLGGAPSLERTIWFTFAGDGNTYLIEAIACGDNPIGDGDTQMAVYSGSCGNLTAVDCNEDGPSAMSSGPYPAGLELETEAGLTYYIMIDGFGPDFEQFGEYCLEVTQLTQALPTVIFQVDASLLVAEGTFEGTMYVAGSFSGFNNIEMSDDDGDDIWTVEFAVDPDMAYTYKFKNGPDGWEPNLPDPCGFGPSGDRQVEVGGGNLTLDVVCFSYCISCEEVAVDDITLQSGIRIFPNPARNLLNVRVELPEAAGNLSVRMLNAFGQVVRESYYGALQTASIEIDVTNIPAGAYMIQVRDGKAQFTQSVIVE